MNKPLVATIIVTGALIVFGLILMQSAEGEPFIFKTDCEESVYCTTLKMLDNQYSIMGYLNAVLEEEKKQTALLDHMDCVLNENIRYNPPYLIVGLSNCGSYPLNVTGVWTP